MWIDEAEDEDHGIVTCRSVGEMGLWERGSSGRQDSGDPLRTSSYAGKENDIC